MLILSGFNLMFPETLPITKRAWDPAPFAAVRQWLHLDKHLLSNKAQRNYKGLKLTASRHNRGIFWTEDTRGQKTHPATSEGTGAKRGVGSKTPPPKGWVNNFKPCLQLDPWTHPSPHHTKETSSGSEKVVCSYSHLLQQGALVKPCLNFLLASSQFILIREGQEPWLIS